MPLKPVTREACDLLLKGSIAMARIEAAGIRVDVAKLKDSIVKVKDSIVRTERAIKESKEHKVWAKVFGNSMNLNSRVQLGKVIFDTLGHKRNPFMEGKNNAAAFEHLKLPFIKDFQNIARMKKALTTNLYGILDETVNGFVHPFINLNLAESYRSSSDTPNFQNIPVRNKDIAKMVREVIIPRKDHVFLEFDYSTQEVKVSYCYNKDPKLKYDILNGDMHTDRTKELYCLNDIELGSIKEDPGKICRYIGKNRFVFAEFYGSYFAQCAPDLWDAISLFDLQTTTGVSLFEHLKRKGITRLGACNPELSPEEGTYEAHVQEVERKMWEESYPIYNKWKKDWWNLYQANGGFNTLTGFRLAGLFRRNQVLCDPIQGSAFHCLLWTIIEAQKEFLKKKLRSKIITQIHDSMLIDCHKNEVQDVMEIITRIGTVEVAKHWKWLIIPLGIETEICVNNWHEKVPYKEGMAI